MTNFPIAQALAADLAGAGVDPNEAHKALAYLRSKRESRALFEYLQAVVNNGDVVIRSRRTLGYYRDLQAACWRHLKQLEANYDQLLATFAWSLRLLRYYRAVPEAVQQPMMPPPEPVVPQQPKVRERHLPAVGTIFTGTILDADDTMVLVAVPEFREEQALGVILAEATVLRRYRVGNAARVEVTSTRQQKSGRTILELKPAPRSQA